MEQDRMPPNKLMFLVNSLQQKLQEYTMDKSIFSKCWETEQWHVKKKKKGHSLTFYIRINSKRIKELNASWDTKTLKGKHKNTC